MNIGKEILSNINIIRALAIKTEYKEWNDNMASFLNLRWGTCDLSFIIYFSGWIQYSWTWDGASVIYYYIFQWVNSVFLVEHEMGHLPFEAEIQDIVQYGSFNFVTVAVNNTLTPHTLPPGKITYKTGK